MQFKSKKMIEHTKGSKINNIFTSIKILINNINYYIRID
jgi:hypothetical protein